MARDVVICEDHRIVFDGLRVLLESTNRYQIVGHAARARELFPLLKTHPAHILLLDLNLPDADGFSVLAPVRAAFPELLIAILTMHSEPALIEKARSLGAHGYLLKNCDNEELISALDALAPGAFYLSPNMPFNVSARAADKSNLGQKLTLTKREIEILQWVCRGYTTQQIAAELFLSTLTIDTHRKNIIRKTGIASVAGWVKFANENFLL